MQDESEKGPLRPMPAFGHCVMLMLTLRFFDFARRGMILWATRDVNITVRSQATQLARSIPIELSVRKVSCQDFSRPLPCFNELARIIALDANAARPRVAIQVVEEIAEGGRLVLQLLVPSSKVDSRHTA